MSESYFFALCPKYLKVDHSFAKNIKPETKYKLAVFKGIQKCDEMTEEVKSKIVNGKIHFPPSELHFNISFFNPTKNIQFHVKLYEQKQNEEFKEIGSYIILSSDYIKLFKTEKKSEFEVSGNILSDLSLDFHLFVEKSKSQLIQDVKKFLSLRSNNNENQNQEDDSKSQKSELSRQFVRHGDGFISPKRKLERKRSPESKPGSRAKSINRSDRSFTSPPVSPRKNELSQKEEESRQDSKLETQQSVYQAQLANSLKFKSANQIFGIEIQNNNSPIKSPKNIETFKKSELKEKNSDTDKELTIFPEIKISISQSTDPKSSLSPSKKDTRKSGGNLLSSDPNFMMEESNIRIFMEESCVNYPPAHIIGSSEQTLTLEIEEKDNKSTLLKTLEEEKEDFMKTGHFRRSIRSTALLRTEVPEEEKQKDKTSEGRKTTIIYTIFLLVSAFLIYNAMTPTRRA